MKIDWQAFDDGVLRLEDRDRAIAALSNDPAAKRELEGLRRLKQTIREAALAEPVPTARLESILKNVTAPTPTKSQRRPLSPWLVAAALAAAVVIAAAAAFMPTSLGGSVNETIAVSSPEEAQRVAAHRSGISVPLIDLGSYGSAKAVHAGKRWACLDFQVEGNTVHIGMEPSICSTSGYEPVQTEHGIYFKNQHSQRVLFEKGGMYYNVHGGDDVQRSKVAELALASISR